MALTGDIKSWNYSAHYEWACKAMLISPEFFMLVIKHLSFYDTNSYSISQWMWLHSQRDVQTYNPKMIYSPVQQQQQQQQFK